MRLESFWIFDMFEKPCLVLFGKPRLAFNHIQPAKTMPSTQQFAPVHMV
jgi:hypothetical protein